MLYPLPDNVQPEGYACVRVWYPDDAGFRKCVLGAISHLGNWWAWERDEAHRGRLAAASFRLAYLLTSQDILDGVGCGCDDEEPPAPPEIPDRETVIEWARFYGLGGSDIESEDDMGQVVTELKIVDGMLRVYYGHCCYEDLFPVSAIPTETDDEQYEWTPPEDYYTEPPSFSWACRKAHAVVNGLVSILTETQDIINDESAATMVKAFNDRLPWVQRSAWRTFVFLTEAAAYGRVAGFPTVTGGEIDTWKCFLSRAFSPGFIFTDEDFTVLQSLFDSDNFFSGDWATETVVNFPKRAGWDRLVKATDYTEEPECPCADAAPTIEPPINYDWLYVMDFREGAWGWQILEGNAAVYEAGVGYTVSDVPQWGSIPTIKRSIEATGGTLRWMRIEWSAWPSATTWSSENWLQVAAGSDWNEVLAPFKPSSAEKLLWIDLPAGALFQVNGAQATNASGGPATLMRVVLAGTGVPPFPSAQESDPVYVP